MSEKQRRNWVPFPKWTNHVRTYRDQTPSTRGRLEHELGSDVPTQAEAGVRQRRAAMMTASLMRAARDESLGIQAAEPAETIVLNSARDGLRRLHQLGVQPGLRVPGPVEVDPARAGRTIRDAYNMREYKSIQLYPLWTASELTKVGPNGPFRSPVPGVKEEFPANRVTGYFMDGAGELYVMDTVTSNNGPGPWPTEGHARKLAPEDVRKGPVLAPKADFGGGREGTLRAPTKPPVQLAEEIYATAPELPPQVVEQQWGALIQTAINFDRVRATSLPEVRIPRFPSGVVDLQTGQF